MGALNFAILLRRSRPVENMLNTFLLACCCEGVSPGLFQWMSPWFSCIGISEDRVIVSSDAFHWERVPFQDIGKESDAIIR